MARMLIGTIPVIRHINPVLPLARALVSHGHEVTGVRYEPFIQARDPP